MTRDPKDVAQNLKRFWDDPDVKDLIQSIREDILDEWETGKTKEKREECHAEIRVLTRLVRKFKAKCDYAEMADTRKLRT